MSVNDLHRDWWESFCHQHEKSEDEMKTLLFHCELSDKEFETLVDCARHYIIDWIYYIDYGKLFASCPRLIECCNWKILDEISWVDLLSQMPELADKCNKWNKFKKDRNFEGKSKELFQKIFGYRRRGFDFGIGLCNFGNGFRFPQLAEIRTKIVH